MRCRRQRTRKIGTRNTVDCNANGTAVEIAPALHKRRGEGPGSRNVASLGNFLTVGRDRGNSTCLQPSALWTAVLLLSPVPSGPMPPRKSRANITSGRATAGSDSRYECGGSTPLKETHDVESESAEADPEPDLGGPTAAGRRRPPGSTAAGAWPSGPCAGSAAGRPATRRPRPIACRPLASSSPGHGLLQTAVRRSDSREPRPTAGLSASVGLSGRAMSPPIRRKFRAG